MGEGEVGEARGEGGPARGEGTGGERSGGGSSTGALCTGFTLVLINELIIQCEERRN